MPILSLDTFFSAHGGHTQAVVSIPLCKISETPISKLRCFRRGRVHARIAAAHTSNHPSKPSAGSVSAGWKPRSWPEPGPDTSYLVRRFQGA